MRNINKLILITSAMLLCTNTYAEDFDSFGDFGDFGGETSSDSASALEVNGSVDSEIRAYVDVDEAKAEKVEIDATPSAALDLKYSGTKSDVELSLKIDEDTIKNHPVDVIDEAVLRGYFGNLTLEAGKMKVVWGKGDKLHVLDNFNADDYSDFIIPDYLDRRISTPMIRAVYSLPFANMNIEGVYTPLLPVDRFATDGRWTPAQVAALTGAATTSAEMYVKKLVTDCETARTGLAAATTIEKSSQLQAAAASAAATEYGNKITEYTNAIAQLKAGIIAAKKAGQDTSALEAQIQQATMAIVHCTAEKTAQEKAAAEYTAAAKNAAAQAADYQNKLTAADTAYTLALNNVTSVSDNIYPDLWTLKYSQFGSRATWTLGQVDMGLSYYYGWYKQPSFNASKLNNFLETYLANGEVSESDKFLAYDRKQTFGLEMSSIIWHFNVRGEFAYNLTDDIDGCDAWVHNNSIAWLGGFDIDLPFWNANLNVQETGSFVLHGDECDKNTMDVDYNKKGYSNNKIVANVTTSFLNDKIAPEVTVMYGIERGDLVVMPKLAFKPDQNLTLTASGMYIHCADEDSEFYAWRKNSFVSLGASYQF